MYQTGEFYVRLLKVLVERYQLAKFSPIETTEVRFTRSELQRVFPRISDGLLAFVPDLLDAEPPTMGGSSGVPLDGEWYRELPRDLLDYADVTDLHSYVSRVVELYTPPPAHLAARSIPQPFDLVASLDYFNTVWQLHFEKPLVQWFNGERTARLSAPVNSFDEFASQLSTVGELLKTLQAPGGAPEDKTPLARVKTNILKLMSEELARSRVEDAVAVLENVATVRNSLLQHTGREQKGARALMDLGVEYPVLDWADAWITVQNRMIEALAVLREELQFLHHNP
jgi:hypothetical protein